LRVLHLIAGVSGGGSERWLRDLVALSPPEVTHRVVSMAPDGGTNPVYADDLVRLGAYDPARFPAPLPALLDYLRRHWPTGSNGLGTLARSAGAGLALVRVATTAYQFQPDVIHSHTVPDFALGVAVSRARSVPFVHTVPCLFSQLYDTGHAWTPRLYGALQSSVACFSTGEGRRELEESGVSPDRILYDLGGVDLERVDAALADRQRHAVEVRRGLGLPSACPIALSVGRLHHSKGHMLALHSLPRLLERVPNVHWVVLGEGDQRGALEDCASRLGVQAHTHFVGYQHEPFRFLAAADVYLRSALLEPENFSFYEAMASGLPAVGVATGEPRDLLVTVGNGIQVPMGAPSAFAEAVAGLLQFPDRGRSLGELGAIYARQNLNIRSSVNRLSSVYLRLASGFDAPGGGQDPATLPANATASDT